MEKDSLSSLIKFYITNVILFFFVNSVYANCTEGQIDINTASSSDLQKITGIGPTYAQRIIEARPFNSLDDLIKVKGIGNATLQKIKNQGLACVSSSDNINQNKRDENYNLEENTQIQNSSQKTNKNQEQKTNQEKINLNSASLNQLLRITGIGEKTAQEIIDTRPFCSLEELTKIKGIGKKTLEKIKEQGIVYVDGEHCEKKEINENEEKISLNNEEKKERSIVENKRKNNKEQEKESIINLDSNKDETKSSITTGKIVYESKNEKIRKYGIYIFSALLVVILFLILKE